MKKKLNQQGFHHVLMIALIVVVVAALGFAGWYVWDKNKADDSANTTNPTVTPTLTTTATPTPIPTAVVVNENELDTLRTFCQGTDPNTVVARLVYAETENGKYGDCAVTDAQGMGGAHVIGKYSGSDWVNIWHGNGVIDVSFCDQHKIPSAINSECHY